LLTGGVDENFTRTDWAGARNFLNDALGSTLALTDSAGTVQTQYTYEPFGKTTGTGATNTSTFQYTSRENDGTGLYNYRARYYNPTLGRFISEDPIRAGNNYYAYALNDPVGWSDPSGLDSTNWFNTTDGRSIFNVPTNGNWGEGLGRRSIPACPQ
jgi:RHS repeat-associated protein